MTRNNYGDRIVMIGSTDGSYSFRIPEHSCLFEIVSSFSVWYLLKCFPGSLLKDGSWEWKGDSEVFSYARKIFSELFFYLLEDRVFSFDKISPLNYFFDFFRKFLRIRKIQQKKMSITGYKKNISKRRLDGLRRESHRVKMLHGEYSEIYIEIEFFQLESVF